MLKLINFVHEYLFDVSKQSHLYWLFVSLFFIQCSTEESLNESDLFYNTEDTTIHQSIDTIVHGTWLPFLIDTSWVVPDLPFNKCEILPSKADSHLYAKIEMTIRPLEFPENGDNDTVINVKPDTIIIQPDIKKLVFPEPKNIFPMRPSNGASIDINFLSVEQGFPSSTVRCIQQDTMGRMWFTTSNSLVCYDGNKTLNFGKENGFISDKLNEIFFDSKGRLWCGSPDGLSVTNGIYIYNYQQNFGENKFDIQHIFEDSKGQIWLSSPGNGVFRFDGEKFYCYGESQGLLAIQASNIIEDRYQRLWVSAYDKAPSIISGDTIFNTSYWGPLWTYIEFEGMEDSKGNLWFSTYGPGLCNVNFDSVKLYEFRPKKPFAEGVVQCAAEDKEGNIWFGTEKSGLYLLPKDSSEYVYFTISNGLNDNSILDIFVDASGNIWVGTLSGGVTKINTKGVRQTREREGIPVNSMASVFVDHHGETYAGFWPGGLYVKKENSWHKIIDDFGLAGSIILDIFEDYNHDIWCSIHGWGLRKFIRNEDEFTFSNTMHLSFLMGLPNHLTYDIFEGHDSTLYFTDAANGLFKMKNGVVDFYTTNSNLPSNSCFMGTINQKNEIFITTIDHGLSRIRNNQIKQITTREGLLSNQTRDVFCDSKNTIWLSYTTNGISKIETNDSTEIITHFKEFDGLKLARINSISEDSLNRIWLASNNGIFCLIPEANSSTNYQCKHLTTLDGLRSMEYLSHSGVIDKNNNMWFTTRQGASSINLNEFSFENYAPYLSWVTLKINDDHIPFTKIKNPSAKFKFEGIEQFTNMPLQLHLNYYQNQIQFQFSAIQWNKKDKMLFSHRLIGLSDEWTNPTNQTEINYSNLSHGKYQLEVRAKIDGEEWGKPISFAFEIHPPWWQTWWFRILTFLLLIYFIYLIFKWRTAQLRNRKEQLEQTVKERTSEIEEQKHIIEEKQKETMDSIYYAKRIQFTLLAHDDLLNQHLPNHFVYFKPKDVVSGDFYWATYKIKSEFNTADLFYLAVCDSTGHGVPGAFMSLLNISFLNEAINEKNIFEPGKILDHTRQRLIENISKEGHQDGMDGILICFDKSNKKITYAAGNNSPVLISSAGIQILPTDKMPIGKSDKTSNFNTFEIIYKEDDMLYLPTDGYSDQFGGTEKKPTGKKFKRNNLNQLFEEIHHGSLIRQKEILDETMINWKGDFEQVDDITIVGIKLNVDLF